MKTYATMIVLGCLISVSVARAESDMPAPEVRPYAVWTSGGCSRSLQQVDSFADVNAALNAVEALTAKRTFAFVIKDGADWSDAYVVLKSLRTQPTEEKLLHGTVYHRTCRSPWQASAERVDAATLAKEVAAEKSATVRTQIVYEVAR